MGRDYWYWGSKTSTATVRTKKAEMKETPGCMSGVLHLFDFHQFQFPITQPPCFKPNSNLQQDPTPTKGVAAPRNSLESDDGMTTEETSMSRELKEEDYDIPMEIRVLARNAMGSEAKDLSCSESCSSPGPKTPSLVARLMGLDLLPDTVSSSPSPSSVKLNKLHRYSEGRNGDDFKCGQQVQRKSNKHKRSQSNLNEKDRSGSISLPDTPRISSARRSDVGPRFSLQINKENMISDEELDYSSPNSRDQKVSRRELRTEEETRSPGHYARQIVKQVKENVSRRVGLLDITNTSSSNNHHPTRLKSEEVDVVLLKCKKPKRLTKLAEESNSNKQHLASTNSPRLRLCEENRQVAILDQASIPSKPQSLPPPPAPIEKSGVKSKFSSNRKSTTQPLPHHQTIEKCKKASCERFTQRKEVRGSKPHLNPPEDKCKNTRLHKENVAVTTESSPSTSLSYDQFQPQASKQSSRLSSCSSRTWCGAPSLNERDDNNFGDGIRYISEMLNCTGLTKDTLVSYARWYSPSHPLDPSIFHHLENVHITPAMGPLKHRCNRKLIFNLMDEMLADILKPYINTKPWHNKHRLGPKDMRGDTLLRCLCSEMKKFPSTHCETLEDIDNLIEKDLPDAKMRRLSTSEEGETIVFEIEQDILDTLVHETAADVIQNPKRRHQLCVTDGHMGFHVTRCAFY